MFDIPRRQNTRQALTVLLPALMKLLKQFELKNKSLPNEYN
jgi:hypothetical protein